MDRIPPGVEESQKKIYEQFYREGLKKGLYELERVLAWLSQIPDTKRQAVQRARVENLIKEYKKTHCL